MWTSIYVADTDKQAARIQKLLEKEGILTNVHPLGAEAAHCLLEIQVMASEVEEARAVLCGEA